LKSGAFHLSFDQMGAWDVLPYRFQVESHGA